MLWQPTLFFKVCSLASLRCTLLDLSLYLSLYLLTLGSAQAADVRIADLEDLHFGSVPPTVGTLSAETRFCVAMQPRGRYSLTANGIGPGGDFELQEVGNSARSIRYNVRVSDRNRRSTRRLRPGVPLNNLRASQFNRNGRCNPRARLSVSVPGGQLSSAAPGRYEGTLSLTVVPE